MAEKYDLIIIGAGPAGLMAAKVAAENGLSVSLLERKNNITAIERSCATMFAIEDDYLFGERMYFNSEQGSFIFPVNGFRVKYDGPYKNFYGQMLYAPDANACVEIGNYEENFNRGDKGRLSVVYDKETLLKGMLKDAEEMGAEIVPGINVNDIKKTQEALVITTSSGDTFEGTFAIAADGLNSRSADILGLNKKRIFYGTVKTISYEVTGVTVPAPFTYKMTNIFEKRYGLPLTYGIVPKATGDNSFWFFIGGDIGNGGSGGVAFTGNQIQCLPSRLGQDSRVWLVDEVADGFTQPVVAAGVAVSLIHALLNNRPGTTRGE